MDVTHGARRIRLTGFATWQVTLAAALLVLGFLIAAQVRAEAPEVQYSSQERQPLVNTVRDLQSQHESLTQQIQDIRKQIDTLRHGGQGNQTELDALNKALRDAQMAAGFVDVEGPGGYIHLADGAPPVGSDANPADFRVAAGDLLVLTDALWRCGAEAMAINDERIVTTTAILDVGGSIVVNSAYVSGPYQVTVIAAGDIWRCFSNANTVRDWMTARYQPARLTLTYEPSEKVVLLGYAGTAGLHNSVVVTPAPTARP